MDKKLTVQPHTVAFSAPLTERQAVDLDIKNDWTKAIIFKMKTTKPDVFKMKPVYGLVEAGNKKKVILTLKKWDPSKKPKKSDHFTIVMAPAPEKCNNPMKIWKSWKEAKRSEASIGACRRQVKITYKGITAKETKIKPSKAEVRKTPTAKDEDVKNNKELEEARGMKKEDAEKMKRKVKVKEDEKGEEEEADEKEEKGTKKVIKEEKEGEKEEEEDEEDEAEEDEKPKKKSKKQKREDEKAKKSGKDEDGGGEEQEDEQDEEDEEE